MFQEIETGQRFLTKFETGRALNEQEDLAEVIGNHITARFGFPVGECRFAGPAYEENRLLESIQKESIQKTQARPILFEHVANYAENVPANLAEIADRRHGEGTDFTVSNIVALTLLDYVLDNRDRHVNNLFYIKNPEGGHEDFIPIDASSGFSMYRRWREKEPGDTQDEFRRWIDAIDGGDKNHFLDVLGDKFKNGEISEEDIHDAVSAIKLRLRKAENESPFRTFGENASRAAGVNGESRKILLVQNGAPVDHMVGFPEARLRYLMRESVYTIVDHLLRRPNP